MPLKTLLSFTACALVGSVFGQTWSTAGDRDVQAALITLRQSSNVFLQLQGTVKVGTTVHSVTADQFWSEGVGTTGSPLDQSELLEYQDGKQIGRIVADGNNVWSYNLVSHEYHTGLYGRYDSGPVSANYETDALTMLKSGANEFGSFTCRLLDQTYSGIIASYQPWVPGADVREVADPAIPNEVDVTYTLGSPLRRRVVFHLTTENDITQLVSIDYLDISKYSGGQQRIVSWTLTPYLVVPSTANYQPYTYSQIPGWRVLTGGN